MRFTLYLVLLFATLPFVLTRPFFGLCVYYVVSLMQPKMLCWRGDFQDGMLVGVPLVMGAIAFGIKRRTLLPQKDHRSGSILSVRETLTRNPLFEPSWPLALMVVLLMYVSVTRFLVPTPISNNSYSYRSLIKLLTVIILLTGLAADLRRFRILYIVVAMSTAFWAIKGGFKVILLGPHQVYGRTYDNNLFALLSVMSLPMVFYYALSVRHARWRAALLVCAALICLAIIGSRSRAGFVALAFVLACMAWSSRFHLRAIVAAGLVAVVAWTMSSQEIRERVTSIIEYRNDKSAMSRFATWDIAMELLDQNPMIGVGFGNFEYAKDKYIGGRKAAHNIFLQNLSELGLIGHPLWLAIIIGTIISLFRLMRRSRSFPPEMRWAYYWSRGLLLGMIAFCIHGFFHNEEYLELMLVMCGLNVALHAVIRREAWHRYLNAAVAAAKERTRAARQAKAKKRKRPVEALNLMFSPSQPRSVALATSPSSVVV
ncbi:MAG TPA: O-antigen ligase family protein [Phycisphaerae bacterium]|nr:O-antigen ligase family protein [Phycisphaerae bacterium]